MFGCNLEKNNSSDILCSNHKSSKNVTKVDYVLMLLANQR